MFLEYRNLVSYNTSFFLIFFQYTVDFSASSPESLKEYLRSLSHWNGNGRNHLLLDTRSSYTNNKPLSNDIQDTSLMIDDAIVASPFFESTLLTNQLRERYDLLIPTFRFHDEGSNLWPQLPYMLPIRRKYLFSFQGAKTKVIF